MSERTAESIVTHLVRLHLDNDEGTYNEVRRIVAEARSSDDALDLAQALVDAGIEPEDARRRAERGAVHPVLRDWVTSLAFGADPDDWDDPGTLPLLAQDIVSHALCLVDWHRFAGDLLDEIDNG